MPPGIISESTKGPATGEGNFCEACSQSFTTTCDLVIHLSTYKHRRATGCENDEEVEELKTSEWPCNLCLKYNYSSQKKLRRHFKGPLHRANVKSQRLAQRRDDDGGQDADDELESDDGEDDNQLSFTSEVQLEVADKSEEETQQRFGTELNAADEMEGTSLAMEEMQTSQSLITKSEFSYQPPPPSPLNLLSLSLVQSPPPLKRGRGRPRKNKTDQSTLTIITSPENLVQKWGSPRKYGPVVSTDLCHIQEGHDEDQQQGEVEIGIVQEETPVPWRWRQNRIENVVDEIASTSEFSPLALQIRVKRGPGRPPKYKSPYRQILLTQTPSVSSVSSAAKRGRGRPCKRPQEDDPKSRGEVGEGKTEGCQVQGRQEESEPNKGSNNIDSGLCPPPAKIKRGRGRPQKTPSSTFTERIRVIRRPSKNKEGSLPPRPPSGESHQVNPGSHPLVEPSNDEQELQEPVQEENQTQGRKFQCVVCNSIFATPYHLDQHFGTRAHAQNSAKSQALDHAEEDDSNADIQIVHEKVEKRPRPPPRIASMYEVGSLFQRNGKWFIVEEVRHRPSSTGDKPSPIINLHLQSSTQETDIITTPAAIHPALALPPGLTPVGPTQILRAGASRFPESSNHEVITIDDDDDKEGTF